MLNGSMPGYPDIAVPFVDVRDVAAAHIAALDRPDAAGQRILVASQESATPLADVAALLRDKLGDAARKVPRRRIPSFVIRVAARFRPEFRGAVPDLGYVKRISTVKERQLLGVTPRPWQTAVLDGARSMIARSLVS